MRRYVSKKEFVELVSSIESGETMTICVEEDGVDKFYDFVGENICGCEVIIYQSVYGQIGLIQDGGILSEYELIEDIYEEFYENGDVFVRM